MESGGGGQMNFWPGFVDALSNMVMAMIFMMMVFMIMMFHYKLHVGTKTGASETEKVKEEYAAQKSQARISELENKVKELNGLLASAQSKPAAPRSGSRTTGSILDHPESISSKGPYVGEAKQSGANPPAVAGDGGVWMVSYTGRDVKLDEQAQKKLQELMEGLSKKQPLPHLVLVAEALQSEGYSDSRRLAYYRALGVRNALLQAGWKPSDIDIQIAVKAEPGTQARVLIRAVEGMANTGSGRVSAP